MSRIIRRRHYHLRIILNGFHTARSGTAPGGPRRICLFAQADNWQELRLQVRDAVDGYFFDQLKPKSIHLHQVRDEVLSTL
jgi:hypothetical protein